MKNEREEVSKKERGRRHKGTNENTLRHVICMGDSWQLASGRGWQIAEGVSGNRGWKQFLREGYLPREARGSLTR